MDSLSIRDLSDPSAGPHAMQILIRDLHAALLTTAPTAILEHRGPRVVSVADNYDALRFPPEAVTRDRRYTRYVTESSVLRTHTSAMIPRLLRDLAKTLTEDDDVVLLAPGIVHRRDCIDRLHTGEPHQIDIWRIARRRVLSLDALDALIGAVVAAVLPGHAHVTTPAVHPYTTNGLQIDVDGVEIGECGLAHPDVLRAAGLPPDAHGLALGLGLDRLVMLRKGVPDVRLLRSRDPRVASQMLDLSPYRAVTTQPSTTRDLSIAMSADADSDAEALGDRVRTALGDRTAAVEEVRVLSETPCAALPEIARERLGATIEQKNVLLRIVLSDLDRTLTHAEANLLRDIVHAALHEGTVHVWACGTAPSELK